MLPMERVYVRKPRSSPIVTLEADVRVIRHSFGHRQSARQNRSTSATAKPGLALQVHAASLRARCQITASLRTTGCGCLDPVS